MMATARRMISRLCSFCNVSPRWAEWTSMSSGRHSRSQVWHRWILFGFWFTQMTFLVVPLLELFLTVILYWSVQESHNWMKRHTYAEWFLLMTSAIIVMTEYHLYTRAKLLPSVFLICQIIKSVQPTWSLHGHVSFFMRHEWHRLTVSVVVQLGAHVLAFWGAIAYGTWVLVVQHREGSKRIDIAMLNQIPEPQLEETVNTANDLRGTRPTVLKLVRWINTKPYLTMTMPALLLAIEWVCYGVKYIVAVIPISVLLSINPRVPGEPFVFIFGADASPPMDWAYVKPHNRDAYSDLEATHDEESAIDAVRLGALDHGEFAAPVHRWRRQSQGELERLLSPRFLCFVTETGSSTSEGEGYVTRRVDESLQKLGDIDYIFISYTRKQFYTQISLDPSVTVAERGLFRAKAKRDAQILTRHAIAAAKEAGVQAFWIDFECIQPEEDDTDNSDIEEVYRICDIVRGSHSMVIVLGPTLDENKDRTQITSREKMFSEWGDRLWTVPEALLCPSEHRISLYGVSNKTTEKIAKRNLPNRVWNDAGKLRQLVDHYESSLHLTQLELISIALECLQRRYTEKRNAGDVAYALMGLLRLRPKVHKADSAFQAFARVSLANDSDMILERLISLGGPYMQSAWYEMSDAWGSKLWQLVPKCQIAGLGSNDTIAIGNASGSSIDWSSLQAVEFTRAGDKCRRSWYFLRYTVTMLKALTITYYIWQFLLLPALTDMIPRIHDTLQGRIDYLVQIYGATFLILCSFTLVIPALLTRHVRSDLETVQARFFGVEGRPILEEVESYVFGASCGRLR